MSRQRQSGGLALVHSALRSSSTALAGGMPGTVMMPAALRRLVRGVAAGLALLLLVTAVALLAAEQRYDGRVYPQVMAGGIDLGGLTADEARAALQTEAAELQARTVTFSYGDKTWTPTLGELGVSIDVERTFADAYEVGREETARTRLGNLARLLRDPHDVPLTVTVDQATLNAWIDRVDADLGLTPHDAFLRIEGTEVTIEPEVEGTVVDRDAVMSLVAHGAETLSIPGGPLPMTAMVAKVRAEDLAGARASVEKALSKPVKLRLGDKTWTLHPDEIAPFIVQSVDPAKQGAEAFTVGIDEQGLSVWLNEKLAGEINKDPVDAKVAWSNDKQGLIAIEESQDGAKLRPLTLARSVVESFWGNHKTVEVPITVLPPTIDSKHLDAMGITTRLAVGDSAYVGSNDGRATNIEVGAKLLNGTLIPPHGEFSFNHSIGVIEESKGYVEASVIAGERIGRDVGGGICQVSTTVFRAALLAGLPITEWWPHTYRLGFYELDGWPPGFDASILQPDGDPFGGGDFKFLNPTDSWMLVESYTENERVYVIIYGADTGYKVDFTDPQISDPIPPPDEDIEIVDENLPPGTIEQSELEQAGVEVVFERTVTGRDGEIVIQDTWDTVFASRPNVWKVSPDMQGKSPASE